MSFPLYCITNRHLYALPFLEQLDRILALRPAGVILREKDLSLEEYLALGRQVLEKCRRAGVPCWFHTFLEAAVELRPDGIQLPMPVLRELSAGWRQGFPGRVGASCHSLDEVQEAARLGGGLLHLQPCVSHPMQAGAAAPGPGSPPAGVRPKSRSHLCSGRGDTGKNPGTGKSRRRRSGDDGVVEDC